MLISSDVAFCLCFFVLGRRLNYYISQIDKELSKYPTLTKIEQQARIPKAYGVLGVFALFALLIFFNIAAGFLSNLLGYALPAYFSIRALDTPQPQDDIQWLTYWIVFGAFSFIEQLLDLTYWFPFYYTFKTLLIIWLMLPSTRGAQVVFQKVLHPVLQSAKTKAAPPAPAAAAPESN